MSVPDEPTRPAGEVGERFEWHPSYRGRTLGQVRDEVRNELARDQRQLALSLEGADRDENAVLASVVTLEKKWGRFDMDWAEADPDALADRIAAFELERERRRELFPFRPTPAAPTAAPAPATGFGGMPRIVWAIAVVVVLALVLLLLAR